MKRIAVSLLMSIFTLFFFVIPSLAQTFNMPGVSCGMAGGTNNSDSCCYYQTVDLPQIPGWIPDPFGVKDSYNEKAEGLKKLQSESQHACIYGAPTTKNIADPACKCELSSTVTAVPAIAKMCEKYLVDDPKVSPGGNKITGNEKTACINCANGAGLWTALGCVPIEFSAFITDFLLRIGIGFAGLCALLCIVYSGIQLQLSRGNPEKIKKAQEMLTSCIMGLTLIIFSVFLLRIIGVNILKIPGFSGK